MPIRAIGGVKENMTFHGQPRIASIVADDFLSTDEEESMNPVCVARLTRWIESGDVDVPETIYQRAKLLANADGDGSEQRIEDHLDDMLEMDLTYQYDGSPIND